MAEQYYGKKEKTSFRDVVLSFLKKILELSTTEFRGGYTKRIFTANSYYDEYIPDSRKCYIQAVENLSHILAPHYDKQMQEIWDEYEESVNSLDQTYYELRKRKIIADWEFKRKKMTAEGEKNHRNFPTEFDLEERLRTIKEGEKYETWRRNKHLEYAQELFRELNKLLKRVDYLKSAVYSESDLEEDTQEVDIDQTE